MSKKLYPDQDINDIIQSEEEEFFKGGVGSGVRGHKTNRPENGSNEPHNGKYGNFDQGNLNPEAEARETSERNKKFDEAVAQDKARMAEKKAGMKGSENRKFTYSKANLKGKLVSQDEFETASIKALMSYSGFDDKAGTYMSRKQMVSAISKETGTPSQQAGETLENLERMGRVKQVGKVFVVMSDVGIKSNK